MNLRYETGLGPYRERCITMELEHGREEDWLK
jgi:hypothetical protein